MKRWCFTGIVAMLLVIAMLPGQVWAEEPTCEPADTTVQAEPSLADLQQQINDLKQQLAGVDELKARLAQLEEQLKTTQVAQKKTEDARAKDAKERKWSGYMQLRYRNDDATDGKDEFLVRRARVSLTGALTPKTSYRLELQADAREGRSGPGSKVQLRTAYVEHKFLENTRARFGQTIIPWGYELEASTADLWTGERAFFMDRLFPEQRDIGVDVQWAKDNQSPVVNVAFFNGSGINASDTNSSRDPAARVKVPFQLSENDSGSAAVSYYNGRDVAGTSAKDGKRLGFGAEATWKKLEFLGEYVTGEDEDEDVKGWYAQLGTSVGDTPGFLFAKYDMYDEDTDQPDDEFKRLSLGYFYEIDPRNRLTLVYENRDVGQNFSEHSRWNDDAYYLQWRVKY